MPIPITMPRLSDTMEEGTLLKWRVETGQEVSAGDHLADVETDKATMELQAFDDGKVARLAVDEGQTVPVGELICVLAGEGESVEEAAKAEAQPAGKAAAEQEADQSGSEGEPPAEPSEKEPASAQAPAAQQADEKRAAAHDDAPDSARIRVSPLARKLADEHSVDLTRLEGSGPGGRIIKRDVLKAAEAGPAAPPAQDGRGAPAPAAPAPAAQLEARTVSVSNMRKTIAKRLVESKTTIPHFTATITINMDPLLELRKTLNQQLEAQGVKLSVNDFITRAAAMACVQHPMVNASWTGDAIQQHGSVNVGVAVALPEERGGGLVVPVVRDVPNLGLRAISEQTRQLAEKARGQGLSQQEMADGTFTISNLGMYGIEHFEAIINPPQAAILALGAAIKKPVVRPDSAGNDQIVPGHEMSATLSGDHRVIDGAIGADYLQTFKQMLENPASLLV